MKINPDHIYNSNFIEFDNDDTNQFTQNLSSLLTRKFLANADTTPDSLNNLVDLYYQVQNIRSSVSEFQTNNETDSTAFKFYSSYLIQIENHISGIFMDHNAKSITGNWAISQLGIGQSMSASLLVLIDINKANTVANLWKFAGLDPKHTKWNPILKNLTWKIGKSFEFYSEDKDCFYGHLYLTDLDRRIKLNDKGHYVQTAQQDAASLDGKLPVSRLEAQARRYATKIFLSHWHHIRYREVFGFDPPQSFKDSSLYITPPAFPF
jgi:hypothetical protein